MASYLPLSDDGLLTWSGNFSAQINADPLPLGLTAAQAAAYGERQSEYATNLTAARNPETRGSATVLAKDTAKKALIAESRKLAMAVTNNLAVTDQQRHDLGLTVRDKQPTPVPPPSVRPGVDLVGVSMRTVTIHIHDSASSSKRGKPAGVLGAKVYTFLGAEYPSDPTLWSYDGDTTKSKHEITFPNSVPSGAQVWVCAAWYNRKGETGPISVPISTNVQGGGASATVNLKLAA